MNQAIEIVNQLAPEHLEIMTQNPDKVLKKVKHAGSIFIGPYSPVPLGDFWAGPNHVLPTNQTARFYSPLSVYDFLKFSGLIEYRKERLERDSKFIIKMAESEDLMAHAKAIKIRMNSL